MLCSSYDNTTLRPVNTIARLTDTTIPVGPHLSNCLSLWTCVWLSNDIRNFLYKLRNNDLSLNNRLNSYDSNVDPRCTFCRIVGPDRTVRDGLNHAFLKCYTSDKLLREVVKRCEPVPDIETQEFRQVFWYGSAITEDDDTEFTNNSNLAGLIIFDLFKYTVWKFRIRRKVPNSVAFLREFDFTLNIVTTGSKRIKDLISAQNMFSNFVRALG